MEKSNLRVYIRLCVCACWLASTFEFGVRGQTGPSHASAMQPYQAYVTAARGEVSEIRKDGLWAISSGERVPVQRLIKTGPDGYARFEVRGGSYFEVFANSRIAFRQNAGSAGDLLDVIAGRVRIHLNPGPGQTQQRVSCAIATVVAGDPATFAIAIGEDEMVRIDVFEGQVRIRHALLPRSEPTLVRAIDAILVQRDKQIVRRVDRGTLYRYTVKPLHDLFAAVTPGRSSAKPEEQHFGCDRLMARAPPVPRFF
ncbi:MAG: FecR domain-containing protein [Acidobacteriaceae bacterium]|nr:FecR domain-containing protein [Acidobacteriaceae bacterium]